MTLGPSAILARSRRLPFGAWVLGALGLHVALYALFRQGSTPLEGPASRPVSPAEYWDLSLEPPAEPTREKHVTSKQASLAPRAAPSLRRPAPPEEPRSDDGVLDDGTAAAEPPAADVTQAAPDASGAEKRLSLDDLGAGLGANRFLAQPGGEAAQAPSAEQRLEQSMREAMVAAEVDLGLTRSGPVLAALRDATYHVAPVANGTAVFTGTVDAGGLVIALEPASVSANFAAWQRVAREAVSALAKKRLRIPSGAAGLRVRFKVSSKMKLPSGHDPGLAVGVAGVSVKKGDGKDSTRLSILEPHVGLTKVEIPNPNGGEPRELPTLKLGITLLGLHGDPVDIGASARRVVQVELLEEKPM